LANDRNGGRLRLIVTSHDDDDDLLLVVLWKRAAISNGFRDMCTHMYLGYDLLRSRDVIGHMTVRYPGTIS